MTKISYAEFKGMLVDVDVPRSEIAKYLTVDPKRKSGPFNPRLVPDPEKVDMTAEGNMDVESAMQWGNDIERWRRGQRFSRRIANGEHRRFPVLVSEGDSWHQFPFLIDEVIDQLERDFLIWSLDAAGDTADNMVNRNPEFKIGLDQQKANGVAGFLFSAAGNDVIGEDEDGNPVILRLLKQFRQGEDADWHVDKAALAAVLANLERDYRRVVNTIRKDKDFAALPIFFHGYDYAIPGGFAGDPRNPFPYARQDEWLGAPLRQKGIHDLGLQRGVIRVLIDALYDMLYRVASESASTHIHIVDVRGTLTDVTDWNDEIHGTDAGFRKVALKFRDKINRVLNIA